MFWKVLTIVLAVISCAAVLLTLSMYSWPDMTPLPHPAEGRIYALNNHGHYIYMNESEHRLWEAMWLMLPILAVCLGAIIHFVDPFSDKARP